MRKQQHNTNDIRIHDDHAVMTLCNRKGICVETVIDIEDVERVVACGYWRPGYDATADAYYPVNRGKLHLHRFIIRCPLGLVTDHANGNTLDNRKQNLRIATHQQNMQNRKLTKDNRSGYRNVSKPKGASVWRYQIKVGNRRYSKRGFPTAEAASSAAKAKRDELGLWDRVDSAA